MRLVSLNNQNDINSLTKDVDDYILFGMPHPSIGMMFGDKDVGKSRAMLSTAYSLALNLDLIGLLPSNPEHRKRRKVAIWDSEDGASRLISRIQKNLSFFDDSVSSIIRENITIVHDVDDEGSQEYLFKDSKSVNHHLINKIKELVKDHDILFIDTIRSAIGYGDELNNDNDIKVILTEISNESNCSIIFLHHMRKSDADLGMKGLRASSSSGLTRTSAKARVQYCIYKKDAASDDSEIHIVRANNLSRKDRESFKLTSFDMGEHSFPLLKDTCEDLTKVLLAVKPLDSSSDNKPESDLIESESSDEETTVINTEEQMPQELNEPQYDVEDFHMREFVPDEDRKYTITKKPQVDDDSSSTPARRRREKLSQLGVQATTVKLKK